MIYKESTQETPLGSFVFYNKGGVAMSLNLIVSAFVVPHTQPHFQAHQLQKRIVDMCKKNIGSTLGWFGVRVESGPRGEFVLTFFRNEGQKHFFEGDLACLRDFVTGNLKNFLSQESRKTVSVKASRGQNAPTKEYVWEIRYS